MKGYRQPVRIHKNSLKIKETLEYIGYEFRNYDPKASFIETYMNGLASHNEHDIEVRHMVIDCGEDEELFFLLASIREDDDYLQQFVWEKIKEYLQMKNNKSLQRFVWEKIKEYLQIKNNKSNG